MTNSAAEDIARWYEYMKFRNNSGRLPKHLYPTQPASDARLKAMASLYIREQDPIDPIRAEILKEICLSLACLPPEDRDRFDRIANEMAMERQ
jgi:hypothetical protein